MNIQQFINNNDYVKSNVSQYLGAESLKNTFTNEVLKEYNYIKSNLLLINDLGTFGIISNNFINNQYYKIKNMRYMFIHEDTPHYPTGAVYFNCNIVLSTDQNLPKSFYKNVIGTRFGGVHTQYRLLNEYDEPPNIILQHTYFD